MRSPAKSSANGFDRRNRSGSRPRGHQAAQILKGKHKPQYTPHVDTGDFAIIINADKIRVTGTKAAAKEYYRHSGFPGGLKSENLHRSHGEAS